MNLAAVLVSVRQQSNLLEKLLIILDYIFHYTDSRITYYLYSRSLADAAEALCLQQSVSPNFASHSCRWVLKLLHADMCFAGTYNIAGLSTRGISVYELSKNAKWWFEPDWLIFCRLHWTQYAIVVLIILGPFSGWESVVRICANVLSFSICCNYKLHLAYAELLGQGQNIWWSEANKWTVTRAWAIDRHIEANCICFVYRRPQVARTWNTVEKEPTF